MSQPSNWPLPPDGIRFFVPRFLVRRLAREAVTRDLYPLCLGYYPCARGHRAERHTHDDHLMIYCVGGAGEVQLNGQSRRVGRGELLLLPRGTAHAYRAARTDPWTIYWVHFEGAADDDYVRLLDLPSDFPVLPIGVVPKLVADFEALTDIRETGYNPTAFVFASNHLKQLFGYLAVLRPRISRSARPPLDLDAIHEHMQAHLHDRIDLDGLAAVAGLSRFHFARKYKQLTGASPVQAFIHLKIERACQLLDVSERTVTDIAASLGYDDAYYFSRLFGKIVGMAPSAYRRLHRG